MNRSIAVRGYLSEDTGYGQLNCAIIQAFQKRDILTYIIPTVVQEHQVPISNELKKCICNEHPLDSELLISAPNFQHTRKRTARFTMWESTRIKPEWVHYMNNEQAVITCSDWNVTSFSACGVNTPIYKVPLFINPLVFYPKQKADNEVFTFGCGGRVGPIGGQQLARKGIMEAIQSFKIAFPTDTNVRLKIKISNVCSIPEQEDKRIEINRDFLTNEQLAAWYRSLNLFITASRGEGWGFMQHQSVACGVPLIGVNYGGLTEFFKGISTKHTYTNAGTFGGLWAEPNLKDLVDNMIYLRNNPSHVKSIARDISQSASNLTIDNTMDMLLPILEAHKIIS